jgi:hypothetical protein
VLPSLSAALVLSGSGFDGISYIGPSGIYRSSDGGLTWSTDTSNAETLTSAVVTDTPCVGDNATGVTHEIINKTYWLLICIIFSFLVTHKLDAIHKFLKQPPAPRTWRSVVALGMRLLFLYFVLRLFEDALLRALLLAIVIAGIYSGAGFGTFVRKILGFRDSRKSCSEAWCTTPEFSPA